MATYETVGQLVHALRTEAGLKQKDIADQLGRPQSFVSKIESGERKVAVIDLPELCDALGVTPARFVTLLFSNGRRPKASRKSK